MLLNAERRLKLCEQATLVVSLAPERRRWASISSPLLQFVARNFAAARSGSADKNAN